MDEHPFFLKQSDLVRTNSDGGNIGSARTKCTTAQNEIFFFEATGICLTAIPSRAFVGFNEQYESLPQFLQG